MEKVSNYLFEKVLNELADQNKNKYELENEKKVVIVTNEKNIFFEAIKDFSIIHPKSIEIAIGNNIANIRLDEIENIFIGNIEEIPDRKLFGAMLSSLAQNKKIFIIEKSGELTYGSKYEYTKGGYKIENTERIRKPSISLSFNSKLYLIEIESIQRVFVEN